MPGIPDRAGETTDRLRTHNTILTGERVVLRPMTEDDWDILLRWNRDPEVLYYAAAVGAALSQAAKLGAGDFRSISERAYVWVLSHQRKDGGFKFFSRGNYELLTDRRSYPRNLSMILYHLLLELKSRRAQFVPREEPVEALSV